MFVGLVNTEAVNRLQLTQQHDEKQVAVAAEMFAAQQEIMELKKEAKTIYRGF